MNSKYVYGGILIAVVIAIGAYFYPKVQVPSFGTAVDCQAVSCFTTVGVLTSFQVDGTTIFNGTVTLAGAVTQSGVARFTGGVYASSTIQTSGPLVNYTTDTATSTTKLGCIQVTATSTATPVKLIIGNINTAASSSYASGSTGFVNWAFGNCP